MRYLFAFNWVFAAILAIWDQTWPFMESLMWITVIAAGMTLVMWNMLNGGPGPMHRATDKVYMGMEADRVRAIEDPEERKRATDEFVRYWSEHNARH